MEGIQFNVDKRKRAAMRRRAMAHSPWCVPYYIGLLAGLIGAVPLYMAIHGYVLAEAKPPLAGVSMPFERMDVFFAIGLTAFVLVVWYALLYTFQWLTMSRHGFSKLRESLTLTSDALVNSYRDRRDDSAYQTETTIRYKDVLALEYDEREGILKITAEVVSYNRYYYYMKQTMEYKKGSELRGADAWRAYALYYDDSDRLIELLSQAAGTEVRSVPLGWVALREKRV